MNPEEAYVALLQSQHEELMARHEKELRWAKLSPEIQSRLIRRAENPNHFYASEGELKKFILTKKT